MQEASGLSQEIFNLLYERVRSAPPRLGTGASEHAPRGPLRFLERRHGLAEIVERGAGHGVSADNAERPSVIHPQSEHRLITLAEDASRYGQRFAQQRHCCFVAL